MCTCYDGRCGTTRSTLYDSLFASHSQERAVYSHSPTKIFLGNSQTKANGVDGSRNDAGRVSADCDRCGGCRERPGTDLGNVEDVEDVEDKAGVLVLRNQCWASCSCLDVDIAAFERIWCGEG